MMLIKSPQDVWDGGLWQETLCEGEYHLPVSRISEKVYIIMVHVVDDPEDPEEHYYDLSIKEGPCVVTLSKGGWVSKQQAFEWFEQQYQKVVELDRILSTPEFQEENP